MSSLFLANIENSGNLFLKKNADNELFLQTSSSDEIFAVTTSSGSALTQENWSGWHAKAAETVDNQNYIAFVNSSDNRVWAAKVSSSGVYSSGAMYTSGTDDYNELEAYANYDFNGDGAIGQTIWITFTRSRKTALHIQNSKYIQIATVLQMRFHQNFP